VKDSGWAVSYVAGFLVLTAVTTNNMGFFSEERGVAAQKTRIVL
jgi:hypothetical protein